MPVIKEEMATPFTNAAIQVLQSELGGEVTAQPPHLETKPLPAKGVIILVGITGDVRGHVALAISGDAARSIASLMIGESITELDEMALSAVAELGNMICGLATIGLEQMGHSCNITPPSVVSGDDAQISTLGVERVVVPLASSFGELALHVSVKDA